MKTEGRQKNNTIYIFDVLLHSYSKSRYYYPLCIRIIPVRSVAFKRLQVDWFPVALLMEETRQMSFNVAEQLGSDKIIWLPTYEWDGFPFPKIECI